MKITKSIAKWSWVVFNIIWVALMFYLSMGAVPEDDIFFIATASIVIFIIFGMPIILIIFNILYGLLYKTKNYLAILLLNIVVTIIVIFILSNIWWGISLFVI